MGGAEDSSETAATEQAREDLTRQTERRAGFIMELRSRGVRSREVLSALERIPRAHFLPAEFTEFALADRSLPIACGQMIEKPSVVARMIEALDIKASHKILDIGTGSGWLAAVLAALAAQVISVDRYRSLAKQARACLAAQSIGNVTVLVRDGLKGVSEHAPFDRIVLAGAVVDVPRALFDQLKPEGVLIAAIGDDQSPQRLTLFRQGETGLAVDDLGLVRFVPLTSGVAKAN